MNSVKPLCQLIGAGRAGRALALTMADAGYRFNWIGSLKKERAGILAKAVGCPEYGAGFRGFSDICGFLVIAVPDNCIADVASGAAAAGIIGDETVAAHLSGAMGSDVLDAARESGASVMAFHPAQTFTPESEPGKVFKGICIDMEGDDRACEFGKNLALDLGAIAVRLSPEQRIKTHLAMAVASNFTVGLVRVAEDIVKSAGVDDKTARAMLMPLFEQTARNIIASGTRTALTGPVSRGDTAVIRKHLDVLEGMDDVYVDIYRAVAQVLMRIAVERGDIPDDRALDRL